MRTTEDYLSGKFCIVCDKANDSTSTLDHDSYKVHEKCLGNYDLIFDNQRLKGYSRDVDANADAEDMKLKSRKVLKVRNNEN